MQGGGTGQFAAVPLNLMSRTGKADYIVTGMHTYILIPNRLWFSHCLYGIKSHIYAFVL